MESKLEIKLNPSSHSHYLNDRIIVSAWPSSKDDETRRKELAKKFVEECKVTVVINLVPDNEIKRKKFHDYRPDFLELNNTIEFARFPCPDMLAFETDKQLLEAVEFLEKRYSEGKTCLVHCWGGHGRSGLVSVVYLARSQKISFVKALALNRKLSQSRAENKRALAGHLLRDEQCAQAFRVIENKYLFYSMGTVLTQFFACKFKDEDGLVYRSTEQYMMAGKARVFKDRQALTMIMDAKTPFKCKQIGRSVKGILGGSWDKNDVKLWDQHKEDVVYKGNMLKFGQNPDLLRELLATASYELCEASEKDKIWGVGLSIEQCIYSPVKNWPKDGQNLLGKILVKVRNSFLNNL